MTNANDVVIEKGLSQGQYVYLNTPDWGENIAINLLEELNGKRNLDKKEEEEEPLATVTGTY